MAIEIKLISDNLSIKEIIKPIENDFHTYFGDINGANKLDIFVRSKKDKIKQDTETIYNSKYINDIHNLTILTFDLVEIANSDISVRKNLWKSKFIPDLLFELTPIGFKKVTR